MGIHVYSYKSHHTTSFDFFVKPKFLDCHITFQCWSWHFCSMCYIVTMKSLDRLGENITKTWMQVAEWYLHPSRATFYGLEVHRAMDLFLEPISGGEEGMQIPFEAMPYFAEWFVFDFRIYNKQTILEHFIETNPFNLNEVQISIYRELHETLISDIFEVKKVEIPGVYELVQLRSGEVFLTGIPNVRLHEHDVCFVSIASFDMMSNAYVAVSAPELFELSRAEALIAAHTVPSFNSMDRYYFEYLPDEEGPQTDEDLAMQQVAEEMEATPQMFTDPCDNTTENACGTCVLCRFNALLEERGIAEDDELSFFTPELDANGRVICGVFVGEGCLTCAVCKLVNKSELDTCIPETAEVTEATKYAQEKEARVFRFPAGIATQEEVEKSEKE